MSPTSTPKHRAPATRAAFLHTPGPDAPALVVEHFATHLAEAARLSEEPATADAFSQGRFYALTDLFADMLQVDRERVRTLAIGFSHRMDGDLAAALIELSQE